MLSVVTAVVPGLTGVSLLARVLGQDGRPITRASLSTIGWTATDLTAGAAIATGTFTVASSVYDALQQTDPRWSKDSATSPGPDGLWGWNFLASLSATLLGAATPQQVPAGWPTPVGPRPVQVDVGFTPVSGARFTASWRLEIQPAYG